VNPQANLAVDILIALYDDERSVDEKKILLRILGGLKLGGGGMEGKADLKAVRKLGILLRFLDEVSVVFLVLPSLVRFLIIFERMKQCPLENATNERLFEKFRKRVEGEFVEELEEVRNLEGEEEDEEVREVYRRIGVDVPGEREDGGGVRRAGVKARARRGESEEEESVHEEDETDVPNESDVAAADEDERDTPRK